MEPKREQMRGIGQSKEETNPPTVLKAPVEASEQNKQTECFINECHSVPAQSNAIAQTIEKTLPSDTAAPAMQQVPTLCRSVLGGG